MSRGDCAPGALVREGRTLVYIPDPSRARAPHGLEPAWLTVFYNPRMEFNRDISVLALRVYTKVLSPVEEPVVVEPLTATGVRAIRYAVEVDGVGKVYAGDLDPCAVKLASMNASLNDAGRRVEVIRGDARATILRVREQLSKPVNIVDLDPFGSPAPFMDVALANISHRGLLMITATDLAVLEGSKPRAALRRYNARVYKTPESKEVGLRVLIGYAARVAAAHDRAIRPLLSFYADHYFRVFMLVERGARRADRMLENHIGHARYCPGDKRTYLDPNSSCITGERGVVIGPLWRSRLNDPDFIKAMAREDREYMGSRERIEKLLDLLLDESTVEDNLHLKIEQAASFARTNMKRVNEILEAIRGLGYVAVRSHFGPTSIRTRAPYWVVVKALQVLG